MSGHGDNRHQDKPSDSHTNRLFHTPDSQQWQSFIDGLQQTPDTQAGPSQTQGSHGPDPTQDASSPTRILLSSPYARSTAFSSVAGQSLGPLPVLDASSVTASSAAASRKRSTVQSGRVEKRKYRATDHVAASAQHRARGSSSEPSGASASSNHNDDGRQDSDDVANDHDSPTTSKPRGGGRGRKPPHELLSDAQKKANHIASEQKRRANIRVGFDQLADIVPTLSHCHRSESLILQKSADYIRQLVDTKNTLRERVRELQTVLGDVPDEDSSDGDPEYTF